MKSKKNVADVLSKVSGVSSKEVAKIFEEVKANMLTLKKCPGPHAFVVEETGPLGPRSYRCRVCKGLAESTDVRWYEEGLAHGRLCR